MPLEDIAEFLDEDLSLVKKISGMVIGNPIMDNNSIAENILNIRMAEV